MIAYFYGKDKANECKSPLMVRHHYRPKPRAAPKEPQVRCRPLKQRQTYFLKVSKSSTIPQAISQLACRRIFLQNRTVVECHVARWCGWYLCLWRTVQLENLDADNRSNSSSELSMINAAENAQRADVSIQSQSVKPFTDYQVPNDSNGSDSEHCR